MCGIAGFVDLQFRSRKIDLESMTSTLEHRGPDAYGNFWIDNGKLQVGLGHARLSILDLSEVANQPMKIGDYVIVYNGEVYNFQEIRKKLEEQGINFKTNSDTEVILQAFILYGKECVDLFIGMFAFVVYNQQTNRIIAFRDRAGVKPFFWYLKDGLFAFGSELKALMAHPKIPREIDLKAMGMYFKYGYIPSPSAIFQNTFKLDPGSWMELAPKMNREFERDEGVYWSVKSVYEAPIYSGTYQDAFHDAKELLQSASNYRLIADVPVGVFLSGGYDSSAVTALLQKNNGSKIKTFTVGFNEGNDESKHARKVANFLGTEHNELICTENEAKEFIPQLPYYYDEPFSDSSAIPTMLVSRFAREQVSVALSADAGDELFAGYSRYKNYLNSIKYFNKKPTYEFLYKYSYKLVQPVLGYKREQALLKKLSVASRSLELSSIREKSLFVFKEMNSAPLAYLKGLMPSYKSSVDHGFEIQGDFKSDLDVALANDYWMYLQNDILQKVDRATMAFSLEGREPLLDHRLIEFAATLPDKFKLQNGNSKRILKDIVHELLPTSIMDRPKSGFSIPLNEWLKKDLSYLIEEYLDESRINKELFDVKFIKYMIKAHKQGKLYFNVMLWRLLIWQMWYIKWGLK